MSKMKIKSIGNIIWLILIIFLCEYSKTFANGQLFLPDQFLAQYDSIQIQNDDQTTLTNRLYSSKNLEHRSNRPLLIEDKTYQLEPRLAQSLGSLVGVTAIPNNRIALFHRGPVVWTPGFFDGPVFPQVNRKKGPIKEDTIVIIDGTTGQLITSFGGNKFYVPHGISSDKHGNLWVTDVALHQVFRYPHTLIDKAIDTNRNDNSTENLLHTNNLNSHIQPDLVFGEPFVPGNDVTMPHFCKPTDVAISKSGIAFIADGYCNERILIVSPEGQVLDTFGSKQRMLTPHSLTLLERDDLVCVADRDRSRILCYNAALNSIANEYDTNDNNDASHQLMFSIDYPLGRVFAIKHYKDHLFVLSISDDGENRAHAATIELANGRISQIWSPHEWNATKATFKMPHDLTISFPSKLNPKISVFIVEATKSNLNTDNQTNKERKLFKYDIQN